MRGEEGTAAVELAILAPVILVLFCAFVFVGDLAVARMRQLSIARLAAWELTAHPLSDELDAGHPARWQAARDAAAAQVQRRFAGKGLLASGMLARGTLGAVDLQPLAMSGTTQVERPATPPGYGSLLETLGSLLQRLGGLQVAALERFGFNVQHAGVVAEVALEVEGTGLLPELPRGIAPSPARLALQVDTWALDDGADVPLPGTDTPLGRQVGRIALFGLAEKLRSAQAGEALSWIPLELGAPVVSMAYGPPARDRSPVGCGGNNALARTGRWENGPRAGTPRDGMSPVRCFDTLPIEANGFGSGGGRKADPVWTTLQRRGPWHMGCDRPGVSFPAGCGGGGERWADASSP